MPVATASSGRALYDHASAAFVHNMPLEALTTVNSAVQNGQASATRQLAEQFVVLHITALCAIYAPNDPDQLESRLKHWRQSSGRGEAQLPAQLTVQLTLPPKRFFAALWAQTLQFFQQIPNVSSLLGPTPPADAQEIVSAPDTLRSALQLPAAVFEALVLGALKVDESLSSPAKNGKKKETPPGLEASRRMCEWVLAAHSSISTIEVNETAEKEHLYAQYGRVLRLYALDILGLRLLDWEYAGEMVRCAKLITNEEREIHERTSLLDELGQAQSQAEARIDKHQAAKERARRYLQEQLEKRKAAAAASASQASSTSAGQRSAISNKRGSESGGGKARPVSRSPLVSPASEKGAEAALLHDDMAKSTQSKTPSRSPSSFQSGDSNKDDPLEARVTRPQEDRQAVRNDSSIALASIRSRVQAWLRHMGGGPVGALLALLTVLIVGRRLLLAIRSSASLAVVGTSTTQLSNSAGRMSKPSKGRLPASSSSQGDGLFTTLVRKIRDTVRMGTQVTYL